MKTHLAIGPVALVGCLFVAAPAQGDPPRKAAMTEMVVRPGQRFSAAEFSKALSEHKLKASILEDGLAKKSIHPDGFDFSPGLSCNVHWIFVPNTAVDQVQWLGKHSCPSQVYDHVKVFFKVPTGDAAVFAELLQAHHGARDTDPTIGLLIPSTVQQNSVETLTVLGQNLTADCYVLIDDHFLNTTYVSANKLTAKLTTDVTGTLGQKEVKVHDVMTGGLSNSLWLTVKP